MILTRFLGEESKVCLFRFVNAQYQGVADKPTRSAVLRAMILTIILKLTRSYTNLQIFEAKVRKPGFCFQIELLNSESGEDTTSEFVGNTRPSR